MGLKNEHQVRRISFLLLLTTSTSSFCNLGTTFYHIHVHWEKIKLYSFTDGFPALTCKVNQLTCELFTSPGNLLSSLLSSPRTVFVVRCIGVNTRCVSSFTKIRNFCWEYCGGWEISFASPPAKLPARRRRTKFARVFDLALMST